MYTYMYTLYVVRLPVFQNGEVNWKSWRIPKARQWQRAMLKPLTFCMVRTFVDDHCSSNCYFHIYSLDFLGCFKECGAGNGKCRCPNFTTFLVLKVNSKTSNSCKFCQMFQIPLQRYIFKVPLVFFLNQDEHAQTSEVLLALLLCWCQGTLVVLVGDP